MNKINKVIFILSTLCAFPVSSGTMGAMAPVNHWYVGGEFGDSISLSSNFAPNFNFALGDTFQLDIPANSDWTRNFGAAPLGGAFIGYEWNPNVAFQVGYIYRGNFNWNLNAVRANSIGIGLFPDVFYRFQSGNIKIQTVLFDLLLKPSVNWGGAVPYVKGGIGVGHNTIGDVLFVDLPYGGAPVSFNNVIKGGSTTNFVWDAGVGMDYYLTQAVSVGLNYRFVDAGGLKTGNTVTQYITPTNGNLITPLETKHVYLNEVSISAAWHF